MLNTNYRHKQERPCLSTICLSCQTEDMILILIRQRKKKQIQFVVTLVANLAILTTN